MVVSERYEERLSLKNDILRYQSLSTVEEQLNEMKRKYHENDLNISEDDYENSTITKFYDGKIIFLTGGTGFLGQLYIEKLLRIGVKRIYCLLRAKKNITAEERVQKMCSGPVFQRLRKRDPNFSKRISVITGDLGKLRADISDSDIQLLCDEVEIVIHAAADVRFNIPIMNLIPTNVRGTREILEIATKMKRLEIFSYVSTAYSHCVRDVIEEKFYEPPMDPEFWLKLLDRDMSDADREIIEILEPHIMNPWPNTYTFTKALSEHLVKTYSGHFPMFVIRPSIVVSTYQDPIGGWTNNITGVNGLGVGIGIGFLRHLHIDDDFIIDIICADFVVNTTLAAIWTTSDKTAQTQPKQIPEPEVYHVTSKGFSLTSRRIAFDSITLRTYEMLHSMKSIYYPVVAFTRYGWQDTLATIFLQAFPSFIMDFFNTEKISLLAVCRKVYLMKNVITFFMQKRIFFDNKNVVKVYERMSEVDKKLFPADSRIFDWVKFRYPYFVGLREFLMDDPLETFPQSMQKLRKLKLIHYTIKYSLISIAIYLLYILLLKPIFDSIVLN